MRAVTLAIGLAFAGSVTSTANAGPCLDVAFTGVSSLGQNTTIADELIATGRFASVADVGLSGYAARADEFDATYVFYGGFDQASNVPPHELAVLRGDRFKQYVEDGGAIVISQGGISDERGPGGTFRTEMMPLTSDSPTPYAFETDSVPFPSEDVLFAGVETLSTGVLMQVSNAATIQPDATIHASWPDGRPMVVSLGSVVAVNVWGVSSAANDGARRGYPADSDMTLLIANSLVYAAGHNPATACNGDYDDDGLSDDDEVAIGTDFQNPDSDADGLLDGTDTCPLLASDDNTDLDGDGQGDACDDDWDGDGVLNDVDNCPRVTNATQNDANQDGNGDACGDDWDADGILNDVDNCPRQSNIEQEDRDDNGVGDACEPDDGRVCGVVPGSAPMGLGVLAGVLLMVRRRRRNKHRDS
jgi:hypothetical protein